MFLFIGKSGTVRMECKHCTIHIATNPHVYLALKLGVTIVCSWIWIMYFIPYMLVNGKTTAAIQTLKHAAVLWMKVDGWTRQWSTLGYVSCKVICVSVKQQHLHGYKSNGCDWEPLPWFDGAERGRRLGPTWLGGAAELMMTVAISAQMVVE